MDEQVLPRSAPKQLRNGEKPFTDSAAAYLREGYSNLTNRICELEDARENVDLPPHLMERLGSENSAVKVKLQGKLKCLCDNSEWRKMGRPDIVLNLSNYQLGRIEEEALSLGLKFDTGDDRKKYAEYVSKNYEYSDSDVNKGFTQGVIACYKALAEKQPNTLPFRYKRALIDLNKNKDIVITQADKGGGVVIMNKSDYVEKMCDLLDDETTYEKMNAGYADNEAKKFKSAVRKILVRTEKGKKLVNLLEEAPRPPRMRGLPKTHKVGIPMRPITSGIGSAPHRLAKRLAKPLSSTLGTISGAHLKNSTDMINRLRNINFSDKIMASFDVKSLFTNVPVEGALKSVKRAIDNISEGDLPVPRADYVKLVTLCVKFGAFTFNDGEYKQHKGLAMGSPLSAVMASLYMETLEVDHFERIMGRSATWYRYVDDVIVIVPKTTNINNKLRMLNNVNSNIQFTIEEEKDGKLPFLDTMIWRSDAVAKFSVYRKNTNKDDFIHYLSAHSRKTKTGVVIGFFLRAIRICSEEYIEEENKYIVQAFKKLRYPEGLILKLKKKAVEIMNRSERNSNNETERRKFLTVPNSNMAHILDDYLTKTTDLKIATSSGTKIGDIVKEKREKDVNKNSVIYKIPCGGCQKVYIGETGRGISQRTAEHKADIRHHRTSNSLVVHIDQHSHMPKWKDTIIIQEGLDKRMRKTMEAAFICVNEVNNHRDGFICWARSAAEIAVAEYGVTGSTDAEVAARDTRATTNGTGSTDAEVTARDTRATATNDQSGATTRRPVR